MTAWEVIGTIVWLTIGILFAAYFLGGTKNRRARKPWRRRVATVLRWVIALALVALGPVILAGSFLYALIAGPCGGLYKRGIKSAGKRKREAQ